MNVEVEKKFDKPSEEAKKALLKNIEDTEVKENHDIYYDFDDYRLLKDNIKLRKRDESFELKIKIAPNSYQEIYDKKEIDRFLKVKYKNEKGVESLNTIADFTYNREIYKRGRINICFDHLNFDDGTKHELCELESMIGGTENIEKTREKIKNFAKDVGLKKTEGLESKLLKYLEKNKSVEFIKEIRESKKGKFNEPFEEVKKENSNELNKNNQTPNKDGPSFKMK